MLRTAAFITLTFYAVSWTTPSWAAQEDAQMSKKQVDCVDISAPMSADDPDRSLPPCASAEETAVLVRGPVTSETPVAPGIAAPFGAGLPDDPNGPQGPGAKPKDQEPDIIAVWVPDSSEPAPPPPPIDPDPVCPNNNAAGVFAQPLPPGGGGNDGGGAGGHWEYLPADAVTKDDADRAGRNSAS